MALQLAAVQAAGNPAEATFLTIASKARYKIDRQVYPPVGKGRHSPGILLAALASGIAQTSVPGVHGDPAMLAKVVDKLAAWSPGFPDGYDPGWNYERALDIDEAEKIAADVIAEIGTAIGLLRRLLEDDEYNALKTELARVRAKQRTVRARQRRIRQNAQGDVTEDAEWLSLEEEAIRLVVREWDIAFRIKGVIWKLNPISRWHAKHGWKAEDYFDDPKAIELCHAIEQDDVEKMERLIAAGADVNSLGKDGMTLLLWAMPDRRFERFECLLEHGADPNVRMQSDFGGVDRMHPHPLGQLPESFSEGRWLKCGRNVAVTHLACVAWDVRYMEAVFAARGDCELRYRGMRPLDLALACNHRHLRVRVLLNAGANPSQTGIEGYADQVTERIKRGSFFIANDLLRIGGHSEKLRPAQVQVIALEMLKAEERLPLHPAENAASYDAIIAWLKEHGADFDNAKAALDATGEPWGEALREQRKAERFAKRQAKQNERAELFRPIREADAADADLPRDWAELTDRRRAAIGDQLKAEELLSAVNARLQRHDSSVPAMRLRDIISARRPEPHWLQVQFQRHVEPTPSQTEEIWAYYVETLDGVQVRVGARTIQTAP